MVTRLAVVLYLASLALLPFGALVRFPWLHENALWGDVCFALATLAWGWAVVRARAVPRLRLVHLGAALYLGWALVSYLAADPRSPSGAAKLLGMAMLVALMVVTSELASRPGVSRAIVITVAATSVLTAALAIVGVALSATGRITALVGTCGDLLPGPLSARRPASRTPTCSRASACSRREWWRGRRAGCLPASARSSRSSSG